MTASSIPQLRCMQPILLEVPDGEHCGTYPSLILDFIEGESLSVGVPLERGREVRISPATAVNVQIARPDGVYVLPSLVVERDTRGPALLLRWPAHQDHVQRRNHVRVQVMIPAEVWTRTNRGGPPGQEERRISGASINLSAGGVLMAVAEPLEIETQVRLRLLLPDGADAGVEARVLRAGENGDAPPSSRFWAALEFIGMLESVGKEITRFVLDVQREHMRKGVA
jgi:c-di-GMP-binding flagellar brake protein YcgR